MPAAGNEPQSESGQDDPRPVFAGDWAKATGKERQAHMTRVAAWKARQPGKGRASAEGGGAEGQSRMVEPSSQPERHVTPATGLSPDAFTADLATLDAIIAAPKSLASDKIRAVEARQRILARKEAEEREQEHGDLVQLRDALALLPEGERVDALGSLLGIAPLPHAVGQGEDVVVEG